MNMKLQTYRLFSRTSLVLTALLLSACASNIPEEIKTAPPLSLELEQVRANPEASVSKQVRWGGIILETQNKKEATWLTVLVLKLNSYGQPITSDNSQGRFIAVVPQFLEPAVYARDRMITVSGKFIRIEKRQVGEFLYEHPVVQVEKHYLWAVEKEMDNFDSPPWWYDPWYHPGYHPYYYPYYYPYWPHHH
ncbi:MAG: Slp family lipoprotein [Gammaproteobacteria bacterium]|nr:Slp family lipoprotein [Gammaproteobacteria bacterium]